MDSSHVSLVSMLLRSDCFEHFRCDRNKSLGIKIPSMAKVLKCAQNDDTVSLKADEDEDHINFLFESKAGDKLSDFEIKLLDIESETLGIPDTDYKAKVTMSSQELMRVVRDLQMLGDTVIITVTKGGVQFSTTGEMGTGNITCRHSDAAVDEDDEEAKKESAQVKIELVEPVTLTFALRYLNFFTRATGLSETVTLSMSPDVPLVVEYRIEDSGYIRYYLAPKIDNE